MPPWKRESADGDVHVFRSEIGFLHGVVAIGFWSSTSHPRHAAAARAGDCHFCTQCRMSTWGCSRLPIRE
eukprot:1008652-Pyramimonas_sp.AAC.1